MTGLVHRRWRFALAASVLTACVCSLIVFAGRSYFASLTSSWIAMLQDASPEVRRQGAMRLNDLAPPTPAVLEALTRALGDDSIGVRQQAAHGLGKFGAEGRSAVPALEQALNDEDPFVRRYAAESLSEITRR